MMKYEEVQPINNLAFVFQFFTFDIDDSVVATVKMLMRKVAADYEHYCQRQETTTK